MKEYKINIVILMKLVLLGFFLCQIPGTFVCLWIFSVSIYVDYHHTITVIVFHRVLLIHMQLIIKWV